MTLKQGVVDLTPRQEETFWVIGAHYLEHEMPHWKDMPYDKLEAFTIKIGHMYDQNTKLLKFARELVRLRSLNGSPLVEQEIRMLAHEAEALVKEHDGQWESP